MISESNDDQNAFLNGFLVTEEDQFNQVSIRLTVIETLEQLGLHDGTSIFLEHGSPDDMNLLQNCIEGFYSSKINTDI